MPDTDKRNVDGTMNHLHKSPSGKILTCKCYYGAGFNTDTATSQSCDAATFVIGDPAEQPVQEFGILIDVDGVIAKGSAPIPDAVEAFKLLKDEEGKLLVPVVFVTNGCSKDSDRAKIIGKLVEADASTFRVVHAQSALQVFRQFHDRRVLVVGQGNIEELAKDCGFQNIVTLDEVRDTFPLLDFVDHERRVELGKNPALIENAKEKQTSFERIEALVLMGEPKNWEMSLQLLCDLLITNGLPNYNPEEPPDTHLPVIACNMDLQFQASAAIPRFGHGAFLACLEALYYKITGRELEYTAIVGKPCEVTTRFAEHCINERADLLGFPSIKRLYFIGDNPTVDMVGSNWYNEYVQKQADLRQKHRKSSFDLSQEVLNANYLPSFRRIPSQSQFYPQTVESCEGILVQTGVFKGTKEELLQRHSTSGSTSSVSSDDNNNRLFVSGDDVKPTTIVPSILEAFQYILHKERIR